MMSTCPGGGTGRRARLKLVLKDGQVMRYSEERGI